MKTSKKTSAKSSAPKNAKKTAAKTSKPAEPTETATTRPLAPPTGSAEEDEGDAEVMEGELLEFVRAIDEYKRINRRQFPTWGEVLRVVRTLGYKRSA